MAAVGLILTHLFEAHMRDGSVIAQTPEDRSALDPALRSAFFDVAQRIDDVEVFVLRGPDHFYLVDLRDGHFEVDGVPFWAQPVTSNCIPRGGKIRLVYFRDHQQDVLVTGTVREDLSVDEHHQLGDHRVAYRIGWEYEAGGKTYMQTIVVS